MVIEMKEKMTQNIIELAVASVLCTIIIVVVAVPIFAGLW